MGAGGILVSLNTMVAELAGERYRGAALAAFQVGFPIGAFLSDFAAPALIDLGGWRWVLVFRPSLITACYLLCAIGLFFVLGSAALNLTMILAGFAAIGFVLHEGMIGLCSTAPALYPSQIRATGMGWAIGFSRAGAVVGPASAGHLLDAVFTVQALFAWFALAAGVAGLAALFLFILESEQTGSGFQTSLTIRL